MSYILKLDSSLVSSHFSDDFTIQYGNQIKTEGAWSVALVKCFLWYSYSNISAAYGNNIIRYSKDGGATWEADITIPDGIYSVGDINTLHKKWHIITTVISLLTCIPSSTRLKPWA